MGMRRVIGTVVPDKSVSAPYISLNRLCPKGLPGTARCRGIGAVAPLVREEFGARPRAVGGIRWTARLRAVGNIDENIRDFRSQYLSNAPTMT